MPNRLIHESSSYLLQHAHNPVDWMPWGDEALQRARSENRLMIVSVGYAACHWCHVMEHESFEDEAVAELMNRHFVCIKVDREERPDIDQVYMDAVMMMAGQGGWPLNAVTLPDGRPVWGGTYFPKEKWMYALRQLAQLWEQDPERMRGFGDNVLEAMREMGNLPQAQDDISLTREELDAMCRGAAFRFDPVYGGPDRVPKFPMPVNLLFMLRQSALDGDRQILNAVTMTLRRMAWGGIFDHAGGGFARYSTDRYWLVPHFEKMLYDNAQLVSLYAEAWLHTRDDLWRETALHTLECIRREFTSPDGGFYSSLDADSEGEEGKFYVWQKAEIEAALGEEAEWFCEFFHVTDAGNWEGNNILHLQEGHDAYARQAGWTTEELKQNIRACMDRLMAVREKRIRPGRDEKQLCSWNALMIRGYADAYAAWGVQEHLDAALRAAEFARQHFMHPKGLWRNHKDGRSSVNAFLDDHALLMDAFIRLHEITGKGEYFEEARSMIPHCQQHFWEEGKKMFRYTSREDARLIAEKFEVQDNVIPASNSVMAHNLFRLSRLTGRTEWEDQAKRMLAVMEGELRKHPSAHANWGMLAQYFRTDFREVAITGPDAEQFALRLMRSAYDPFCVISWSEHKNGNEAPLLSDRFRNGETLVWICRNQSCGLPLQDAAAAETEFRRRH